jgi:hypothetical protein
MGVLPPQWLSHLSVISGHALTGTPSKCAFLTSWVSLNPVELTSKMNLHSYYPRISQPQASTWSQKVQQSLHLQPISLLWSTQTCFKCHGSDQGRQPPAMLTLMLAFNQELLVSSAPDALSSIQPLSLITSMT